MIGIYGIHNLENDKWYVGQSINIERRWRHHKLFLRNGTHCNQHLLRAWNYYGESSFDFVVLEECDVDELNDSECRWIAKLNSLKSGYNLCDGGDSHIGRVVSDESKQAESLARMGEGNPFYGKHHTVEWKENASNRQLGCANHMYGKYGDLHPRSRKVRCVETGVVYSAMREAERETGINRNNISSCCSGRLKTAGKFHWEYVM